MRKLALSLAVGIAAVTTFAASPAATQQWTSNLVARAVASLHVSTSNAPNAKIFSAGSGNGTVVISIEDPTVYSIMATNVTPLSVAQGVTNNMYFVWNGLIHSYTNHAQVIEATPSNFVWRTIQSVGNSFSNYFSVVGRILQPSYAKEVTK